ncbi:transposase, partial [Macellibacteroides fermentans]|uniref:transposase n=1 Tax=Macellibacteroides fermentans TaxID=879969 RepID=UPI002C88483E|nr:hypothetical protein [Macellibacteroides fermentans]
MSTKRQIVESSGIYFITITCYEWLPLFELTNGYDIVYKWFDYLKQQGHFITGYVPIAIGMPNHLHVLIAFRQGDKSINSIVGNGKRFMAYETVKRLELAGEKDTLNKLMEGVTSRDHKRGKLHEVFQPSFDWKECRINKFINQKLNYIHDNPCRGKWNLAESPVDYAHSSARFYLTGEPGICEIFHCGLLEDID